jgi:DNA-3-methyladenine glycosylase I
MSVGLLKGTDGLFRCPWAGDDPLYIRYHDEEWGRPLRDDRKLFELLLLEGAQAGLSWITVLRKRENYRAAFDGFDPEKIVTYDEAKIAALLQNEGIVRNRLKVRGFVKNARAYLDLTTAEGSFSRWVWGFVDNTPIVNHWKSMAEIPAETALSKTLSAELKRRGFTFVGPTIVYAFMQAAGLVEDHLEGCFRRTG